MLDDIALHHFRINEVGHAELRAPFLTRRIDVDADDHIGPRHLRALQHVEPDPAQTEYDDIVTGFNLCGIGYSTNACGHAATDVARTVKRCILADFGNGDFGQNGEIGKGRAAHIMKYGPALVGEPRCTVWHQPLALRSADSGAQIGFAAQAAFALATFRSVERDNVITGFNRSHPSTDFTHYSRTLMAQHARENPLAVKTIQGVCIGMANAGRHNLDQHFPGFRPLQIQLDNLERFLCFKRNGSAGLHGYSFLNFYAALTIRSRKPQP